MLVVAKKCVDPSLFLRLNTIPKSSDTTANDVQYRLTCWVDKKDRLNPIQLIFGKSFICKGSLLVLKLITQYKQYLYYKIHYKSMLKENDRLNHALLGNSKKKSIELMHRLLLTQIFFCF